MIKCSLISPSINYWSLFQQAQLKNIPTTIVNAHVNLYFSETENRVVEMFVSIVYHHTRNTILGQNIC